MEGCDGEKQSRLLPHGGNYDLKSFIAEREREREREERERAGRLEDGPIERGKIEEIEKVKLDMGSL
jgi:hypothetical protein